MKVRRKYEVLVDHHLCKKCGICVFVCPKKVFSLSDELKVDSERCNGCRRCEVYCPDFAIEIVELQRGGVNEGRVRSEDSEKGAIAGK
ncbi:2-ketoglutarate ferredoxin oxidoreductase subunit delta [Archaeoglobales archaeon]|nr:MAG: 2-ketoglutarate ferredoxin oxidoreductase subunit delta [Archaeoglobales archaeon]